MIKEVLIGISLILLSILSMIYSIRSIFLDVSILSIVQLSIAISITTLTLYLIISTLNLSTPYVKKLIDFEINGRLENIDLNIYSADKILTHGLGKNPNENEIEHNKLELISLLEEALLVAFNKENLDVGDNPNNIRSIGFMTLSFSDRESLELGFELIINSKTSKISILKK